MGRKVLFGLLTLLLLGGATRGYLYFHERQSPPQYLTSPVERGRIATTVNATGTVNALVNVQVGSQVSGIIQKLFVDFNSPVQENQVIAQIDPALFEAKLNQARANVANTEAMLQVARATVENHRAAVDTARANLDSARATVQKARVALVDAHRTHERHKELVRRALIPQSELDTAQTAHDTAVSQLKLSEAQQEATEGQLKSALAQGRLAEAQYTAAQAQVEQARAALQAAALDLQHTTIRAPVQGIVIARNVDVGQTVAASFQAPILFLIAQDLTQIQVDTSVSEADIGQVSVGQRATFTVDAYPQITFTGKVVQVRNAPITVQNVVTYNAVVQVANPESKLKPGMTANVAFLIAERNDVLRVPNAALRFQLDGAGQHVSAQDNREARSGGGGGRIQEVQQRLTRELALTPEQQARLEEIAQTVRQRFLALREAGLSEERRRAQSREIQAQAQAQIEEFLTTEQRQKFAELFKPRDDSTPQGRPGRVWVAGSEGMPEPRSLTLGIADDTHTEVLSGNLSVGEQIITGVLTTARSAARSGPPGFGSRPF